MGLFFSLGYAFAERWQTIGELTGGIGHRVLLAALATGLLGVGLNALRRHRASTGSRGSGRRDVARGARAPRLSVVGPATSGPHPKRAVSAARGNMAVSGYEVYDLLGRRVGRADELYTDREGRPRSVAVRPIFSVPDRDLLLPVRAIDVDDENRTAFPEDGEGRSHVRA